MQVQLGLTIAQGLFDSGYGAELSRVRTEFRLQMRNSRNLGGGKQGLLDPPCFRAWQLGSVAWTPD